MNNQQFLYEQFDTVSKMGFLKTGIPEYISDNLNPRFQLRPYQKEAFSRFLYYFTDYPEKLTPTHLLFNMATGSGKTLIMAGLILYLYQQGYRNFLFFVNTKNIIEKTKDNFLNSESAKYLFSPKINFEGRLVNIRQVDNFEGVNTDDINICFTTIQKLHTDLYNERENSITYEDFKDKRIVLLSDESHHIQAKTKQKTLLEALEKPSWENTVEKIFWQNNKNMLLEFTATLDFLDKSIVEKYYPKIIYRYDLKEFRNDGYSKDVNIMQSDLKENNRMLQAVILSQYRQEVAGKYKINLKPVILFKAQKTIAESKENQTKFHELIDELSEKDINNIRERSNIDLIQRAFRFFAENKITDTLLIRKLKSSFASNKCINVNEENMDKKSIRQTDRQELILQQHVLNSLEDKDNQIRAIFAVQKLNEGWDVLNLFDIVRLYQTRDSKGGKPGKTTIAEAQLIGRGARYFPFITKEADNQYIRKFDEDLAHDLRILEELHYHSVNDSKYITELKIALKQKGLYDDDMVEKKLNLKEEFKKKSFYKNGIIYLNEQIKNKNENVSSFKDLGVKSKNIQYSITSGYGEDKAIFIDKENGNGNGVATKSRDLKIKEIEKHITQNAITRNEFFAFGNLKAYFPHIQSIQEFIESENYLAGLEITFSGTENDLEALTNKHKLDALIVLLAQIETEIKGNTTDYKGTDKFKPRALAQVFYDKVLNLNKNSERADGQEDFVSDKKWYVFNANYGTSEEKKFVKMMEKQMDKLSEKFEDIYLVRNELHFKIYNFADGQAFAPDFVLFLRTKDGQAITYQIFIEPKGAYLKKLDKWKEDLLRQIKEKYKDKIVKFSDSKKYKITGVPFYNNEEENEFKETLYETLS